MHSAVDEGECCEIPQSLAMVTSDALFAGAVQERSSCPQPTARTCAAISSSRHRNVCEPSRATVAEPAVKRTRQGTAKPVARPPQVCSSVSLPVPNSCTM
jgi:hypothetical protein